MVLRAISFAIAVMLVLIACNSFKFDDELPASPSSSSSPDGVPPSGSSSSLSPSSGDGGGPSSSSSSSPGDGGSSSSRSSVLASSSSLATSSSSSLKGCEGTFNPANKFCYDGDIYDKCDGMEYIPVSQICENGVAVSARCNGAGYNPLMQGCCGNTLFSKATQRCGSGSIIQTSCGSSWYNAATQFCQAGTNEVKSLCGGATFTAAEFCSGGEVLGKCGGTEEYNPSTENCCGSNKYTLATQFCQAGTNEVKSLCGGATFTAAKFCSGGEVLGKCGGTVEYNSATQFCQTGTNEVKDLCGGETYTSAEGCCGGSKYTIASQFCQAGSNAVKELCGGAEFTAAQFCSGTSIVGKCGGTVEYAPSTEGCCGSNKYTLASQGCCGTATFTQASHFCYASSSKVGSFCGNNPQKSYDPDKYECKPGTNANGIYLKTVLTDGRDSKTYEAVLIGTQTWMAKNLNYATGGKCGYGSSLSDNNTSSCDTYGRLYNWSTAMAGSATSSKNPSEVNGVCPTGWHIPSDAEWNALMKYVNPSCADNSDCADAGTKLKATRGWYSNGNGTDEYGFSALPGGDGYYSSNDTNYGLNGYWWSATEDDASAYTRRMNYNYAGVNRNNLSKAYLFSVRCVQD